MERYDIAFADTCIGGSTVASQLASATPVCAFFLADYLVNPLGTKTSAEVSDALLRWLNIAGERSSTVVIACNTASIRLLDSTDVRQYAAENDLALYSMVDLVDLLLDRDAERIRGKRVCVMGTAFTVTSGVYAGRLRAAGAADVVALPATQTERVIAHLQHETDEGRAAIRAEISEALESADAVLHACTCFPLIRDLVDEISSGIIQLDPGEMVSSLISAGSDDRSSLVLAVSGDVLSDEELSVQVPVIFDGFDSAEIQRLRD